MSKRAEQKSIEWQKAHNPMAIGGGNFADIVDMYNTNPAYIAGYEQAEQDIITLIESRIGEILGDAQPAPILRIELQELIKRIKEGAE